MEKYLQVESCGEVTLGSWLPVSRNLILGRKFGNESFGGEIVWGQLWKVDIPQPAVGKPVAGLKLRNPY